MSVISRSLFVGIMTENHNIKLWLFGIFAFDELRQVSATVFSHKWLIMVQLCKHIEVKSMADKHIDHLLRIFFVAQIQVGQLR